MTTLPSAPFILFFGKSHAVKDGVGAVYVPQVKLRFVPAEESKAMVLEDLETPVYMQGSLRRWGGGFFVSQCN